MCSTAETGAGPGCRRLTGHAPVQARLCPSSVALGRVLGVRAGPGAPPAPRHPVHERGGRERDSEDEDAGGRGGDHPRALQHGALRIDGQRPLFLGSVIQDDNASLSADLANPDIMQGDEVETPRDILEIGRTKLLWDGACFERIGLHNYDARARTFRLSFRFDADFRDLFEVRGSRRKKRGDRTAHVIDAAATEFVYRGLDDITRRTRICFSPAPRFTDVRR